MKTKKVHTLIIGSGFSGRCVASHLPKSEYLIIERGEFRNHKKMLSRYYQQKKSDLPYWQNAPAAYTSDLAFNKKYNLSGSIKSFSQFEFIGGGSSNRWDGNAVRIPDYIFNESHNQFLNWPFSYKDITPFYKKVEQKLNLCGDYIDLNPGMPKTKINSADQVRSFFKPTGLNIYLRNQAKNPLHSSQLQKKCLGAGVCEICPMDAKARPDNIYPNNNILYGTYAQKILFKKNRAVAVKCLSEEQKPLTIYFKQLIIAAHAIESARLLWNSKNNLPSQVLFQNIGHYFQDHAQANILVRAPFQLPANTVPFKSSFAISELCKKINDIDIRISFSRANPKFTPLEWQMWFQSQHVQANSLQKLKEEHRHLLDFALTFEIPPRHSCYIDFKGKTPKIQDSDYQNLMILYDKIYEQEIRPTLNKHGFQVVAYRPHYRHIIGQHHLVGTLNMSDSDQAVTSTEFRLNGTENVYIAGTSLIPRLGAPNPTLTALALSKWLGENLAKSG